MAVTEETRPSSSPSTSALGLEPAIRHYMFSVEPEGIIWPSLMSQRGASVYRSSLYPFSFAHAQVLLDWVRQQEVARLENLLIERAAAFDGLDQVLLEQRKGTVDLLFVVSGDLYSRETVVLEWIQDLREALRHLELDFVVVPSSASAAAESWHGARVLYVRGTGSSRQG